MLDISHAEATKTVTELGSGAFAISVDISAPASMESLVNVVMRPVGRIDILVNNAGVFAAQPWFEITTEEFDRVFNVSVRRLDLVAQAVAAPMTTARSAALSIQLPVLVAEVARRGPFIRLAQTQ